MFLSENRSKHAAVYSRQPCLFSIPEPRGASLHYASYRHHSVCFWQQLVANLPRGMLRTFNLHVKCLWWLVTKV